jgi:hypothetical protein
MRRALVPHDASEICHPDGICIFRGLRVRMGMHSGVPEPTDVNHNRQTGRMQYSGPGMVMAKVGLAA